MSKEFLSSLPEVMNHYSQCNLLLPTSTDVQLNPFYKFHVEEVPVDLVENSGDIFKSRLCRQRIERSVWKNYMG